jgi:HSP20 family protein
MVLFQNDPFRDLDAAFDRMTSRSRAATGPAPMAMDAYRRDSDVWVHLDLPGVSADSIDINLERNVLTVTAQRDWAYEENDQIYFAERRQGAFSRQVHIGEGLDAERIEANYRDGVLTLRIPVAERAQPRKIAITTSDDAIESGGG